MRSTGSGDEGQTFKPDSELYKLCGLGKEASFVRGNKDCYLTDWTKS
jgi:hypothetical protein